MNSNTGNAQTHEAADQRTAPRSSSPPRYEVGPANAHNLNDPKDQRSLSNRVAVEIKEERALEKQEREAQKMDPTLPAKEHGNRPSRGAEIDKELQQDDQLRMKEKGIDAA